MMKGWGNGSPRARCALAMTGTRGTERKGRENRTIESTGAIYRKNEDGGGGSAGRSESEAEDSCGAARLYLRGGALLSAKKRADCARGKHTAATRGEVKEKLT